MFDKVNKILWFFVTLQTFINFGLVTVFYLTWKKFQKKVRVYGSDEHHD